jgi:plasmid stabilization system protein ParE
LLPKTSKRLSVLSHRIAGPPLRNWLIIFSAIEQASDMPKANRIVSEKEDESIREIILRPYRIIYSVDLRRKAIYVLRIWHAARGNPEI